jgi:hypothetical protein
VSETTTEPQVAATNGHAAAPAAAPQAATASRAPVRWEYAPAPESTDHVRLRDRYGLFIGGDFVAPARSPSARAPGTTTRTRRRSSAPRGRSCSAGSSSRCSRGHSFEKSSARP